MKFANLHLHSTASDAGFRPAHLVVLAKALGYGGLAVTDHETIRGVPELIETAKVQGMEYMSGVELYAAVCKGGPVFHITGLDFNIYDPGMIAFTEMMTERRNEHTRAQFEAAVERGLFPSNVTWDDIVAHNPGSTWFCNDQVYHALDAMGVVPFYRRGETYQAAFKSGAPKNIKIYVPEAAEVISVIRNAGGVACLAHPSDGAFKYVPDLVKMGLNGIEICHPDITEYAEKHAVAAAVQYNLYVSGGTDHTGPMSACGGNLAIPAYQGVTQDEFNAIKERRFG